VSRVGHDDLDVTQSLSVRCNLRYDVVSTRLLELNKSREATSLHTLEFPSGVFVSHRSHRELHEGCAALIWALTTRWHCWSRL